MKLVIYCFFATVICLVLICGCRPAPPKRDTWLGCPFSAEIAGELHGVPFTAKLVGEGGEGMLSVAYLTPDAPKGITVCVPLKADGSLGESVEIARGEMVKQLPLRAAEGLLLPLRILLSHASDDAATVQKVEAGYLFTFSDGVVLSVTPEGIPLSVTSPDLSYQIVWWESSKGEETLEKSESAA